MFGKDKNQGESPKKKSKKGIKIIVGVGAVVLAAVVLICVFAGGSDENKPIFPNLGEYAAEYIEYYDEKETDEYVIIWYLIEESDLPELDKYKEAVVEDYDFEQVDGDDDDFYFRYIGEEKVAPLFTDNNHQEYHLRVGIGDEKVSGKSLVCLMYAKELEAFKENVPQDDSDDDDENKVTSGKDNVLVEPLTFNNSASEKQSKDSVKFQSLFDFASDDMDFGAINQSGLVFTQVFEGNTEDVELIDEYIKLLCKDGMNFKEQNSVFEDYRDYNSSTNDLKIYASWGLSYTGTSSVAENCEYNDFGKKGPSAIYVYYSLKGTTVGGYIKWSEDLESTDLGFRNGGKTESTAPGGTSAGAGLVKTGDGKYKTTDNRFIVGLNEATAIIGGNKQNCSVEFVDYESASDLVNIKDADGKKIFVAFLSNVDPVKTGKLYGMSDLAQEYQYVLSGDPGGAYNHDKPEVYQLVRTKWITPGLQEDSACNDATLRIVYYNKDENVAVFYAYTDLQGGSEFFCAVDLSKAAAQQSSGSSGSSGSSSAGLDSDIFTQKDKTCNYCGGTGYVTCSTCGGKGYYVVRGSAPNYAGSTSGGRYYEEHKPCPGVRCEGGRKKCLYCKS